MGTQTVSDTTKGLSQNRQEGAGPAEPLPQPFRKEYLLGLARTAPGPSPLAQEKTALLYIGSVSIASGHRVDLLPDILELVRKELPNVQLTIAGSGDDAKSLKKAFAAKNLESAVTWHGRYTSEDAASLIAAADVIIDPIDSSITNRAKSSSRVLNAIAVGKPIVTSNIGIRSQIIPVAFHGRFFADPADVDSYAARTVSLLQQSLTDAERSALKTSAMRYTWSVLGREYLKLLA